MTTKDNGLYGTTEQNTFAHTTSFMRRLQTRSQVKEADVAVVGVPFDLATSNRPGARFGPRAIRTASTQLAWGEHWPWGFDPFERIAVIDYGDLEIDFGRSPISTHNTVIDEFKSILEQGTSTLMLGGDHYLTYPALKAYKEKYGPLALVHFDAHSDTWSEDNRSINHGTMFYHAVKEGVIDPKHSIQIGIRTFNEDPLGIEWLDADLVHGRSPEIIAERIRNRVGDRKAYLTFDIDCLDPSVAPGTGTPVCGGLFVHQVRAIFRALAKRHFKMVGMDVMEVAPAYDHAEITSLAAATIALDYLCILCCDSG